jgi:outer membrane protein assembly factor BamD
MKYRALFVIALSFIFSFSSCSFQKILKNGTVDEKYEAAVKLYNQKDYSRALQLFDQLIGAMRATDKSQKIYYYYAYCYYNQKDYTLASYYFKRYTTNFPNTPEAEECMFMSAFCNVQISPEYSLDQTPTYDALKDLQLFTNTYPTSKRVSECNDLIDKLRLKLEMKDYKLAKMYYRMDDYAASIKGFSNILKDFPDSPHREEVMFLIVKSYYSFAKESILEKQKERYAKVAASYNDFAAQFPTGKLTAEAADLKERSIIELAALNSKPQKK